MHVAGRRGHLLVGGREDVPGVGARADPQRAEVLLRPPLARRSRADDGPRTAPRYDDDPGRTMDRAVGAVGTAVPRPAPPVPGDAVPLAGRGASPTDARTVARLAV